MPKVIRPVSLALSRIGYQKRGERLERECFISFIPYASKDLSAARLWKEFSRSPEPIIGLRLSDRR